MTWFSQGQEPSLTHHLTDAGTSDLGVGMAQRKVASSNPTQSHLTSFWFSPPTPALLAVVVVRAIASPPPHTPLHIQPSVCG